MEKLFHRARRMDRTRAMTEPRLLAARTRADALRTALAALEAHPDDDTVVAQARLLLGEAVGAAPPKVQRGPQARQPFRVFRTRDGARVLVGKTSEENDLLTHKVARGNDIFLHARDAHGSHVILVLSLIHI